MIDIQNKQIDFIGDIHGHYSSLESLLIKMGYEKKNNSFKHSERIPFFIGDYIDRGPEIHKVLNLVRTMQEDGNAFAIMGNHEYNYLCFHSKDENDLAFRKNSQKNLNQLIETNNALNNLSERSSYLNWMSTLPITIETSDFRAVHAQWDDLAISQMKLAGIKKLDRDGLIKLHSDKKYLNSIEVLLKGIEVTLPKSLHYKDIEGHERKESRVKWWGTNGGNKFGDIFASIPEDKIDIDVSDFKFEFNSCYEASNKPVFFGHYWLSPSEFRLTSHNTCCLDFSIAKNGLLASYRFSGEKNLNSVNLVRHD
jgi:hypothetical protein